MSGCHHLKNNVKIYCPEFPEPKKEVIAKIRDINNIQVDNWMKDLFILKKTLYNCQTTQNNNNK